MASKFYLYGSSPDSLAQQQAAQEGRFTRTAEGNRAANVDAQQFNIQAWVQAQRQDEAARERDAENRMRAFQFQTVSGENNRRFDVGQAQVATERARAESLQNRFDIPAAQQNLETGRLNLERLKERPALEETARVGKLAEFMANPEAARLPVESIATMFNVKPEVVKPYFERADADLAVTDAARLNQALNARIAAMTRTFANQVPKEETPELRETARRAVEAEAGKIHSGVKFNPVTKYWQVGEAAAPIAESPFTMPATFSTGTSPLSAFGSTFTPPMTASPFQFSQPGGGMSKVQLANEISAANPALTREQVIAEVNRQFSQ